MEWFDIIVVLSSLLLFELTGYLMKENKKKQSDSSLYAGSGSYVPYVDSGSVSSSSCDGGSCDGGCCCDGGGC
jgi:hypothetical protein